jgi:hypothetical protein
MPPTPKGATYRFIGDSPEILANGRPVEPGEMLDNLSDEDIAQGYNTLLIYDGKIIGTNAAGEQQVQAAKQRAEAWIAAENPSEVPQSMAQIFAAPEATTTDETKEG